MTTHEVTNDLESATIDAIRSRGIARLDPAVRDFLEGGSGKEFTLRRNTAMFDSWAFAQSVMSGNEFPSLATSFMGIDLRLPILTAPFGADKLFHPQGQKAVMRAAQRAGAASIAPEASSFSLESLATEAPKAAAFGQLHPIGSEEHVLKIIERYEKAKYQILVLTLDCPTPGWREHNLRNGYVIAHEETGGNYPPDTEESMEKALGQLHVHEDPVWSWSQLSAVMAETSLPWMAKGVLTPGDARKAVEAGASAVLVSNHGGRQLDGSLSTIEALPAIAREVGGEVPIALDSGIRQGTDIIKALALGADVVAIGRAAAYGLAADGEKGVFAVLELLRREMQTILQLLGHGSVRDLTPLAVIDLRNP